MPGRTCQACGTAIAAESPPVPSRRATVDVDLGDGTVKNHRPVLVEITVAPRGPAGGDLCDGCIGRAAFIAAEMLLRD